MNIVIYLDKVSNHLILRGFYKCQMLFILDKNKQHVRGVGAILNKNTNFCMAFIINHYKLGSFLALKDIKI